MKIKRILSVYLVFVILFSSLGFLNVYGAFEASEYGKEVYLGVNDKPENWYEITDEDYKKIIEIQAAEVENGGYN